MITFGGILAIAFVLYEWKWAPVPIMPCMSPLSPFAPVASVLTYYQYGCSKLLIARTCMGSLSWVELPSTGTSSTVRSLR